MSHWEKIPAKPAPDRFQTYWHNSTVPSYACWTRLGVRNVARQARFFDAGLEQAVQLILTGSCSVF
jgi:hypothetical protein